MSDLTAAAVGAVLTVALGASILAVGVLAYTAAFGDTVPDLPLITADDVRRGLSASLRQALAGANATALWG